MPEPAVIAAASLGGHLSDILLDPHDLYARKTPGKERKKILDREYYLVGGEIGIYGTKEQSDVVAAFGGLSDGTTARKSWTPHSILRSMLAVEAKPRLQHPQGWRCVS
ncbi:hypothetical protein Q9189_004260 [Teloschistes chrysophthalmus]